MDPQYELGSIVFKGHGGQGSNGRRFLDLIFSLNPFLGIQLPYSRNQRQPQCLQQKSHPMYIDRKLFLFKICTLPPPNPGIRHIVYRDSALDSGIQHNPEEMFV